jgi:8-oxo-dGTP pyrophosphatase MutT (NUDIX family)
VTSPDDRGSGEFAVLVLLVPCEGRERILLTKRPDTLERYAGHVSFPGGAREAGDPDLAATALRETEEEVGIPGALVRIEGELGWFETALGHRVKPYVGRLLESVEPRPDPREVERILWLEAAALAPELFREKGRFMDSAGRERITYAFELGGCEVWGLTARILREVALDRRLLAARRPSPGDSERGPRGERSPPSAMRGPSP